ncbi:hypothetical protein Ddc_22882 [Ditylenchus destructor]|nr:hypothetical protein Ddc_22882 [Ditylenchus destructor]
MDTQNILCHGVKRRRANSPSNQNQRLLREKVNIPDDTWLEALKFLTCPQWSQKRFVSRQINGIAQRNILRLPKMVLDSATMYYINSRSIVSPVKKLDKYTIVTFDTVLKKKDSTQWLKNRDFTLDAPVDIPAENALIGANKWACRYDCNVHICIYGSAQVINLLSYEQKRLPWFQTVHAHGHYSDAMKFRKPVLYYAQFNPLLNQYSWDYLAQFLKFVYHPTSYIKEVKMFAVNQNFIDSLKCNVDSVDNEPRYIRYPYPDIIPDSLKWLARNVRAEKIDLPWILQTSETYDHVANFLLDPTGAKQCASEKITICVSNHNVFLNILVEKFHSIPLVEDSIPTIEYLYFRNEKIPAHLGPNLIDQEVDSEGAEALYMISNGQNRMRVSFCLAHWHDYECKVRIYSI